MSYYQQTLNLLRAKREDLRVLRRRLEEAETNNQVLTVDNPIYLKIADVEDEISGLKGKLSQLVEPVEANITISEDRTRRGHFEDDKLRALQPRKIITPPCDTVQVTSIETKPRPVKVSRHGRYSGTRPQSQAEKAETNEWEDYDTVGVRMQREDSSISDRMSATHQDDARSELTCSTTKLPAADRVLTPSIHVGSGIMGDASVTYEIDKSDLKSFKTKRLMWKIVHRVQSSVKNENRSRGLRSRDEDEATDRLLVSLYLDAPHLLYHNDFYDNEEPSVTLRGDVPIPDLHSYLSRHPEIVFVVFKNYDTDTIIGGIREALEQYDETQPPQKVEHTGESLMVVSGNTWRGIRSMFQKLGSDQTPQVNIELLRELEAPYLWVFHHRDALNGVAKSSTAVIRNVWALILYYVDAAYGTEHHNVRKMMQDGRVTRRHIEYLFKPGDVVVCGGDASRTAYEIKEVQTTSPLGGMQGSQVYDFPISRPKKQTEVSIETWHWDFDGLFKKITKGLHLQLNGPLDLEIPIASLDIFPIRFSESRIIKRIKHRGLELWKSRHCRYVSYKVQWDSQDIRSTDDRYMIDIETYKKLHPKAMRWNDLDDLGSSAMKSREPPEDPFLLLLPETLPGFNMRTKQWEDLDVELFTDVVWNTQAFDHLVLGGNTKNLIKALIMRQIDAHKATDLIGGKGNGLIILLHGGPGTGKTYTAESVAEIAQKPLYRVTCGDVGTDPEQVEKYMGSVLELGKKWDCVVLLDEADVYLEERSLDNLRRNALVSVFLRQLEYNNGILILTSNRVGTFDEAFKSRIQLALHYEDLTVPQRKQIWDNFFTHLQDLEDEEQNIDFDDMRSNLKNLASYKMNGRQIRNAITTARQLSLYEEKTMRFEDLKKVIEIAQKFEKYTNKINEGRPDDEMARDKGFRA